MDEKEVREVLGEDVFHNDGGLHSLGWYLSWSRGNGKATLDGEFTASELKAIAWWMENRE